MTVPTRLDKAGQNFIARHEGEVLYVYNDTALRTRQPFGIGHLLHEGPVTRRRPPEVRVA